MSPALRTHAGSRRLGALALAAAALALALPAAAGAAIAPPVLDAPANGLDSLVEGNSVSLQWHGALQGDPDAVDRAFFRVEVLPAADVPVGAQAEWTNLETSASTAGGDATATSATIGVPSAGSYRWRVCAWGVVDVDVANEIQQLPGGCSAARAFSSSAGAARADAPIGTIEQKTTVRTEGKTRVITEERPSEPIVDDPVNTVIDRAPREIVETVFQTVAPRSVKRRGSVVALPADRLEADTAAERDGLGGSVMGGLSTTLPGIPIPFWTLVLLLATVPLASAWRRNVLGMFEWDEREHDAA